MRLFRYGKTGEGYDPYKWIMAERIRELKTEYNVLDHGYVRYINHMGTEESIIEAARQSTQKGFLGWDDVMHSTVCASTLPNGKCTCAGAKKGDAHLLEYLYKNKHTSPFEMCELIVQVKAPIMVFRQWHRHRTQSYNEWSGRYSQLKDEFYIPVPRMQGKVNKQGSEQSVNDLSNLKVHFGGGDENPITWMELWGHEQREIYETYETAIEEGISKEVARTNMPVSVYSIMWAKANLHNWLHFLKSRMDPHAQFETREYANAVADLIKQIWPRTYELFEEYTLYSESLSRSDIKTLLKHFNSGLDDKMADLHNLNALVKRLEEKANGNL